MTAEILSWSRRAGFCLHALDGATLREDEANREMAAEMKKPPAFAGDGKVMPRRISPELASLSIERRRRHPRSAASTAAVSEVSPRGRYPGPGRASVSSTVVSAATAIATARRRARLVHVAAYR